MSETTTGAPVAAPDAAAVPGSPVGVDPAVTAAPAAGTPAAPAGTLLTDAPVADPAAAVVPPVESTPAPITPVTYEEFTLPEGLAKDSPLLATFGVEAGKLGIPQAQAQALVTAVGQKLAADAKVQAEQQMSTWVTTNEKWQAEIKADPQIGGAKFEAMKTSVAKLFDDYVGAVNSPERKALNEALLHTGAGNNPALVRAFAKIAAAHTEGGFVAGSAGRGAVDIAALMYPSMTK